MRREPMTVTSGDFADVVLWPMCAPTMGRTHGLKCGQLVEQAGGLAHQ
jgi:hypothetical protein